MKIAQKIETAGINRTMMPRFKPFAMTAPLDPSNAARHIAHCALAGNDNAASTKAATLHCHKRFPNRKAFITYYFPQLPVQSSPPRRALPA